VDPLEVLHDLLDRHPRPLGHAEPREAQDGVHGGAQFVRDVGEEDRLGAGGVLGDLLRPVEVRRAQTDPAVELVAGLAQLRVLALDLFEHRVEAVHEPPELILPALGRAEGIVPLFAHARRRVYEVQQRLGDGLLQAERESHGQEQGRREDDPRRGQIGAPPRGQLAQIRLQDGPAAPLPAVLDLLAEKEVIVAEVHPGRLQARGRARCLGVAMVRDEELSLLVIESG